MVELPVVLEIDEIRNEAKDVRSFFFVSNFRAQPGQFIMLWLPRINQKPFGVSYLEEGRFGVTVSKVGHFTEELFKLKKGDRVGIQGPYGKPFTIQGERALLVGGGYGTAPLGFLADELSKLGKEIYMLVGAKNKEYLCYQDRFQDMVCCTDDGSCGIKGFTTDVLEDMLKKKKIDMIYTCGPEIMMKRVIELSDEYDILCQVSLERYMKCGFGVCGQCAVDPIGVCVCKEGPVFDKSVVKQITEFSKYKRDGTGARVDA